MATFGDYLGKTAVGGRDTVVVGDWNIAHTELDIKNWKGNKKSSGFLPNERAWLDELFAEDSGWVDVPRKLHPGVEGPYSWWSYRGKASTMTPAGASTTRWRLQRSPSAHSPRSSSAPPATTCAGPTMLR